MFPDLSQKIPYNPNADEAKFILDAYTDFIYDRKLRMQVQPILDGRTIQQFWDQSNEDYNVIVGPEDLNDPVTPYASAISRDKANMFISTLTQQLLYPQVAAQNSEQEIDRVVSKVSRSVLEWQYENDGRPSESGSLKNARNVHKMVTEGTVHVQDDVTEDGRLVSAIVPNEEIYIKDLYQPNIQLQPHVIRMSNVITYEEAEMEFGGLQKFIDHVLPGVFAQFRLLEESEFRQWWFSINPKDAVSVMRIWRVVPRNKLREYKNRGLLPKYVKKAKYFNIIINGVLMFPPETLMPYYHGNYPISKGIFEWFSDPNFYYGNSLPNKARHDKKWYDGFKQLIRYKAKLAVIPPLITFNGQFIDSDIVVPGMMTAAPSGMGKDDVQAIPGISNGLSAADFQIMNDGVNDIERATTPSMTGGQSGSSRTTAREALINNENAQRVMMGFAMQVAFLVEARTFPILSMSYQFLPRQYVNKICVPDQQLPGGKTGSLEVFFVPPKEFTEEELHETELAIYKAEKDAEKKGNPKKIVYLNYEYLTSLDFFCKAVADQLIKETGALREAKAEAHFKTYLSRPDIFNVKSAARKVTDAYGDDPEEMILPEPKIDQNQEAMMQGVNPVPGMQPTGMGSGGGQNSISKMNEQQSSRNNAPGLEAF